jgi:hypothetical protein
MLLHHNKKSERGRDKGEREGVNKIYRLCGVRKGGVLKYIFILLRMEEGLFNKR